MPKYRVCETSFIDNRLVREGEIVDYDGEPSANLQPVKGKKAGNDLADALAQAHAEVEQASNAAVAARMASDGNPADSALSNAANEAEDRKAQAEAALAALQA